MEINVKLQDIINFYIKYLNKIHNQDLGYHGNQMFLKDENGKEYFDNALYTTLGSYVRFLTQDEKPKFIKDAKNTMPKV